MANSQSNALCPTSASLTFSAAEINVKESSNPVYGGFFSTEMTSQVALLSPMAIYIHRRIQEQYTHEMRVALPTITPYITVAYQPCVKGKGGSGNNHILLSTTQPEHSHK